MPNHCDGDLFVYGKEKDLIEFKEFAITKKEIAGTDGLEGINILDHQNFIPSPNRARANLELVSDPQMKQKLIMLYNLENESTFDWEKNWHDWALQHWGTKWGIYDSKIIKQTKTQLVYTFLTAWSPCYPVIWAMAKAFPKLRFKYKYYERGVGYSGIMVVKDGNLLKDDYNDKYRGNRGG